MILQTNDTKMAIFYNYFAKLPVYSKVYIAMDPKNNVIKGLKLGISWSGIEIDLYLYKPAEFVLISTCYHMSCCLWGWHH